MQDLKKKKLSKIQEFLVTILLTIFITVPLLILNDRSEACRWSDNESECFFGFLRSPKLLKILVVFASLAFFVQIITQLLNPLAKN